MAKLHIRRTILFIIIGVLCGLIYSMVTPKVYEGIVQLVISNPGGGSIRPAGFLSPDVQQVYDTGQPRNPLTELTILRGRGLFFEALQETATKLGKPDMIQDFERYYAMYDVLGEKESDAALIQARAFEPEVAAELANTIANKYNEQRVRVAREATGKSVAYLDDQIEKAEIDLSASLAARQAFKDKNTIGDFEAALGQAQLYETTTRQNLDQAKAALSAAEAEVIASRQNLRSSSGRQEAERVESKNPLITKLEGDLTDLFAAKSRALAQYYEDHPNVKGIDDAIASVRKDLAEARKKDMISSSRVDRVDPARTQIEVGLAEALVKRDTLRESVQDYQVIANAQQQRIRTLAEAEKTLSTLEQNVKVQEANLGNLKLQRENLKNRTDIGQSVAQIIFPARASKEVVFPDPLLVVLISVFGGAALGLLYSFAVESLRLRIYTSYQLADLTGLPVVASLPRLPGTSARQITSSLGTASPKILESMRLLAFSLVAQPSAGCRKLLFSGIDRGIGTSSAAGQLAIALGHTGGRVILVDADLTGRSLSKTFRAESQKGFAEALMSDANLETISEYLRETETANVKVLPAGVINDRALKECESKRLDEVLAWLAGRCDYLVFDCPPCLRNSEAARLASDTDEVYLVVSLKLSTVPVVSTALDILRQAGADVVRIITTEGDRAEEALAREARVTSASRALPS